MGPEHYQCSADELAHKVPHDGVCVYMPLDRLAHLCELEAWHGEGDERNRSARLRRSLRSLSDLRHRRIHGLSARSGTERFSVRSLCPGAVASMFAGSVGSRSDSELPLHRVRHSHGTDVCDVWKEWRVHVCSAHRRDHGDCRVYLGDGVALPGPHDGLRLDRGHNLRCRMLLVSGSGLSAPSVGAPQGACDARKGVLDLRGHIVGRALDVRLHTQQLA
mmetsp:Transcript_126379/g.365864  ORF Transcript_126379/g.365864 Transcript_126379/m.365864 type:complete len:219 (-) Transcript_126379:287-943(-)